MKKYPIRNQMVEHLTRLGNSSTQNVSKGLDAVAHTYHYHSNVEVVIVKCGWAEELAGDIKGKLQQGMVMVLGSDVPHCILRTSDDYSFLLLHIPTELFKWDEERFPELHHGIEFIRLSKSGILYNDPELATKLARLAGRIASADGFMRMSLLMRLLHILSTTPPTLMLKAERHCLNGKKESESPIDRAYRYLYGHFREQLSLNDLANYSGLHPAALCRSFKKASGHTVGHFCSRLRIEYACNLLLTTDMDVTQIAYQSGYNSYPHFCTQFKKTMKMTPTEYRGITGHSTSLP